jgi:hypothetical protein
MIRSNIDSVQRPLTKCANFEDRSLDDPPPCTIEPDRTTFELLFMLNLES